MFLFFVCIWKDTKTGNPKQNKIEEILWDLAVRVIRNPQGSIREAKRPHTVQCL